MMTEIALMARRRPLGFLSQHDIAGEIEHRPRWFDAIEPSADFGILEKSWCNHD